jgi:hypothetical protein
MQSSRALLAAVLLFTLAVPTVRADDAPPGAGLWREEPGAAVNYPVAGSSPACAERLRLDLDFRLWPEVPEAEFADLSGCLGSFADPSPEDWTPH